MNNLKLKHTTEYEDLKLYSLDLQFFAEDSPTGQKTEDATPKRRNKARQDGDVMKSMELNTLIVILSGFLGVKYLGGYFVKNIAGFLNDTYRNFTFSLDDIEQFKLLMSKSFYAIALTGGPIIACVFLGALIVNLVQVGFLFTLKPFKLDFTKFNPANGLKKLVSMKNIVEMLKAIGKLIVIAFFPIKTISSNFMILVNTCKMPMMVGLKIILDILSKIIWQIIAALVIIAAIDYWYQWYTYEKKLKMSKYDIKKEREDQEGKPEVKQAQRRKMQEIMRGDMLSKIPDADVVITNPIHYAVVIKYDQNGDSPPYVVAKGALKLALKIKEIAKEADVPIVENKPLARSLYKEVAIGEAIPEEFFKTVAEILAYVYKLKNKTY